MRLRSIVIAACWTLTACVPGRPVHYYTINPPVFAAAAPKSDGPVLVVGRITTTEMLQDERICYRAGSNEVGAYEYQRWAERPAVIVRDQLTEALRNSGRFRQVLAESASPVGDYVVRGRLRELSEIDDPGIQTWISLRLELVDRKSGGTVWSHDYSRDEPVSGRTMAAVVVSMEHNLHQVMQAAAAAIAAAAH